MEGTEVRVELSEGNEFEEVLEVEAETESWRWGGGRCGQFVLLATRDADGDLVDVPVADWMDDVLARFDVRTVGA